MNRVNLLDQVFEKLRKKRDTALIAYMSAGYPAFPAEEKILKTLVEAGVDVLELGIPFSDPIADGPTIQFAAHEALQNHSSLEKILRWIGRLRRDISCPIVLMGYLNPILSFGFKKFAAEAARVGVQGLIVPDLIKEEGMELERILRKKCLHLIYLVAPTTPKDRRRAIARRSSGFLYAVSVTGVTGARRKFSPEIYPWLKSLRTLSARPVCVGFGISSPEQIHELKRCADGVIVGSALIDLVRRSHGAARLRKVRQFIQSLAKECHHARPS